jgi:hypothetical protein
MCISYESRGGGGQCKLPRPSSPEGGPVLDYVAYVFVFVFLSSITILRLYQLTLSNQA